MKQLRLFVFILCGLTQFAFANEVNKKLIIKQVIATPMTGSTYNLSLFLSVQQNIDAHWNLGFFMLNVLQNPKLNLKMQICQLEFPYHCQDLKFAINPQPLSASDTNRPDLTSGHTIIVQPQTKFALVAKHNYQIIIQGVKYLPKNISAMPQSFFISTNSLKFAPIDVLNYQVANYLESQILLNESKDILTHWQANESWVADFSTPLVPRPQLINYHAGFLNYIESNNKINKPTKINFYSCSEFKLQCSGLHNNPEGYRLDIKSDRVDIYAFNQVGSLYAQQSLDQLNYYYAGKIPLQEIQDYPQFHYRGIMLDTVRHYFSESQINKLLEVMFAQKLNTLHLHVADDEGWRIELNNFAQLTQISSTRFLGYKIGSANLVDGKFDISNLEHEQYANANTQYAGYYSLVQIRRIITKANQLGITIIPEIEMPGHARALKKAYPEILFDFKQPSNLLSVQGYTDNVLPVYLYNQESKFTTIINQITQDSAQQFNHQQTLYAIDNEISLAGDEVPSNSYPGSKSAIDVTHKFFTDLSNNLPEYKISGWEQLVISDNGTFSDNAVLPAKVGHIWIWAPINNRWGGMSALERTKILLAKGYPVVADYSDYAYLDIRYSQKFMEPGLYWSTAFVNTWKTYSLGSQIAQFSTESNFLGIEGALWSELVPSDNHLWYMLLPKMTGIAEAGWSNSGKDSWNDFAIRLGCGNNGFLAYLHDKYLVNYRGLGYGIAQEIPEGICQQ